jgi:hypothetical protein
MLDIVLYIIAAIVTILLLPTILGVAVLLLSSIVLMGLVLVGSCVMFCSLCVEWLQRVFTRKSK